MDELNSEETSSDWRTPNSSEFGTFENDCAKRLEFEETEEVANKLENLKLSNGHGDGNDSGVDTGATNPIQLQRALSSNSAGYASSGGLDAQFASCNSSLLSVCSDSNEGQLKAIDLSSKRSVDCTSENGSESSSLSGEKQRLRQTPPKKRTADPNQSKSPRNFDNSASKNRMRAASATRSISQRLFCAPNLATTERARSREKQITPNSQSSPTKRAKPVTLPTKDTTPVQKCSTLRRAASVSRRTPSCTPTTEDGRWPSNQFRAASKTPSRPANEPIVMRTRHGPIVLDNRSDRFSTMPGMSKVKSEEDLSQWRMSRSSSTTRDRMTTSTLTRRQSTRESPMKNTPPFLPRCQKPTPKTLIYHEAAIQTALTIQDIDDAFAGNPKQIHIDTVTKTNSASQTDIRDKEIQRLQEKIRQMTDENQMLRKDLAARSQLLTSTEEQLVRERDEKTLMQKELQSNTERVMGMLETVHAPFAEDTCDSLLMLESQIQLSGHALEEKQSEINNLRQFCQKLQAEMNRSILVQQTLLDEKKCIEQETSELQDFLQDEKAAIFEALKDAETELEQYQEKLKAKDHKVEKLQEECRHLVRISEQRRQEFLGMQTKYAALESRCAGDLLRQDHAVCGATGALSDLGQRLNELVKQIIASYNISEQDIEDVIYHNEAYTSSEEASPEDENKPIAKAITSPQRHRSFVSAVINAIKNAATTSKQKAAKLQSLDANMDRQMEMLDSETEPCLMMEDVSIPDSQSQQITSPPVRSPICVLEDNQEDSLQNLCAAIENRQKIEEQATFMMLNQSVHEDANQESTVSPPHFSYDSSVQKLVEHVINVDNLVTKLLKVLRIIQIEDDHQQISTDKENHDQNEHFKSNGDTPKHLIKNVNGTTHSNTQLKSVNFDSNHDSRNHLITAKSHPSYTFHNHMKCKDIADIRMDTTIDSILRKEPKVLDMIYSEENGNNDTKPSQYNFKHEGGDTKSQNDTITKAIETLNSIQSIVRQCPALVDLQHDLQQMLPPDLNANTD